jgi:thioredoxin-like negative regulator of GroEL
MTTSRALSGTVACCAALWLLSAAGARAQEVAWRQDYSQARQEAASKGRPLVIDFGTENCFWCKQLDARTFRDPEIVRLLNDRCVPLKVDAQRYATLANALHVQNYPTLVFASPEGKILGYQEGFVEAPALKEHLDKLLAAAVAPAAPTKAAAPEWMAREFREAGKACESADYGRALALLKHISGEGADGPVRTQARQKLQEIEAKANSQCTRARDLADRGKHGEAVEVLNDLARSYPGTLAAREGGRLMATLASRSVSRPTSGGARAQGLLAQAREDYRARQYLACLDRCEALLSGFADSQEATEAGQLAAEIKANPEWTKRACEQLADRLGMLYLAQAEGWLKRGQPQQAVFYFERVVQAFPNSRHAEVALGRLLQLQGPPGRKPYHEKDGK